MNAYLVSRFLHAFPGNKPPHAPVAKQLDLPTWTVEQPLQTLSFENEAWAHQWCQQQGVDSATLQYHHKTVSREQFIALENLLALQKSEKEVGAMGPSTFENVPARYLDGLFAWFKAQPQIDMTAPLVKMAFSVNRVDVAHYVGAMMEKVIPYWVTPLQAQPFEDPLVPDELNRIFRDALLSLAPNPREMQWFLEHNPAIKEICQRQPIWEKLDRYVQGQTDTELKTSWPWIAHTVFQKDSDPLQTSIQLLVEPTFWRLLTSYAHNPAAQCSLVQQKYTATELQNKTTTIGAIKNIKKSNYRNYEAYSEYSYERPHKSLKQKKEKAFVCTQALALHHHLNNHGFAQDKQLRTCVQLLRMGLEEGFTKESFYAHAKQVLNPHATPDVRLPSLD